MNNIAESSCTYEVHQGVSGELLLALIGDWTSTAKTPNFQAVRQAIDSQYPQVRQVVFVTDRLQQWDSRLVMFISHWHEYCQSRGIVLDTQALPLGVERLIALACSAPKKSADDSQLLDKSIFYHIGQSSVDMTRASWDVLIFIGECLIHTGRFFKRKSNMRWQDLSFLIQQCGAEALPIVTLISFLVGFILAFVGSIQLGQFGANIYVANLVGLAMVREMGAMMAAIIMCGRTGAAFAAQLGSMKVSEELDAFRTLGIAPIDFLVLPRLLALTLMLPLLTMYADFVGMIGGLVVAMAKLDISMTQYISQTHGAIRMNDFLSGIIKSVVFGIIVAATGCLRGMQCGSNSAAVGQATTSAVVTGITLIIVADAVFTVIFNIFSF